MGGSGGLHLSRAIAFYELLGFSFPPLDPEMKHTEIEGAVRRMIDDAAFLTELHGEPARPGNIAGLAVLFDSPPEVDEAAGRVPPPGTPW